MSDVNYRRIHTHTHTHTDTETETDRQRHRETDRQTDTHTETDRQRQTDRDRERETVRERNKNSIFAIGFGRPYCGLTDVRDALPAFFAARAGKDSTTVLKRLSRRFL